jgi:amino acid transporter
LLASLLVIPTVFTYAELSARYPLSSGSALYFFKAFKIKTITTIIGLMVIATGILSAATMLNDFAGYIAEFIKMYDYIVISLILTILTIIALWGIKQSVLFTALLTIIETLGLVIIIYFGYDALITFDLSSYLGGFDFSNSSLLITIVAGSFLAFYAFIGFEDMVNIAEEVIEPQKTMPRAIIISLMIATLIYMLIALVAITAIDIKTLGSSAAPLSLIYEQISNLNPNLISIIALIAITNGILIQIIMVSRMIYGMGVNAWMPKIFATINPTTKTPIYATIATALVIFTLAVLLPMVKLAELTSLFILLIFSLMHLSLLRIKKHSPQPLGITTYHPIIAILGLVSNLIFIGFYFLSS